MGGIEEGAEAGLEERDLGDEARTVGGEQFCAEQSKRRQGLY